MTEYNTKIGGRGAGEKATPDPAPAMQDPLHIHADGEDTLGPDSLDGQVHILDVCMCVFHLSGSKGFDGKRWMHFCGWLYPHVAKAARVDGGVCILQSVDW